MLHFGLTACVNSVLGGLGPGTSTTTTKSRMPWGDWLFLKIAEFCVAHVMEKRRQRQTFQELQKQKETTAKRGELESRIVLLARVIQNGKRKYLVKS